MSKVNGISRTDLLTIATHRAGSEVNIRIYVPLVSWIITIHLLHGYALVWTDLLAEGTPNTVIKAQEYPEPEPVGVIRLLFRILHRYRLLENVFAHSYNCLYCAYRVHVRSPAMRNLSVLPYLAKDVMIADLFSISGTTDLVFGEVDR